MGSRWNVTDVPRAAVALARSITTGTTTTGVLFEIETAGGTTARTWSTPERTKLEIENELLLGLQAPLEQLPNEKL